METLNDLIQSTQPVLVDFYADWCAPCKAMQPVIKEVAEAVSGKTRVVKVNIDKNVQAARQYTITTVPTFMLFKNGSVLWRHSGAIDKASLLRVLVQNAS